MYTPTGTSSEIIDLCGFSNRGVVLGKYTSATSTSSPRTEDVTHELPRSSTRWVPNSQPKWKSHLLIIVLQSSHFTDNGGTHDYAYGLNRVEDLARKFPDLAVMNADSHEYFAVGDDADEGRPGVSASDQAYLGV